jgi:hypothetical protein
MGQRRMTMKKVMLLAVVAAAAALGGCAAIGKGIDNGIEAIQTPKISIEACETLNGKTLSEFKELIGDPEVEPVQISADPGGKGRRYLFAKGKFHAALKIVDGKIAGSECWKGGGIAPPSEARM